MPTNIFMDQRLTESRASSYRAAIIELVIRVYREIDATIATQILNELSVNLSNKMYDVNDAFEVEIKFDLLVNTTLELEQQDYIKNIIEHIVDASSYVEQCHFNHYVSIISEEINKFIANLENRTSQDRANYLAILRAERLNVIGRRNKTPAYLEIAYDANLDATEIELMKKIGIDPRTKKPEVLVCFSVHDLLEQAQSIIDIADAMEASSESTSYHETASAIVAATAESVEDIEIKLKDVAATVFKMSHGTYCNFDVFDLREKIAPMLQSLLDLFNGSNFTIEQFLELNLTRKRFLFHKSKGVINRLHDPSDQEILEFHLPILAQHYYLTDNKPEDANEEINPPIIEFLKEKGIVDLTEIKITHAKLMAMLKSLTYLMNQGVLSYAQFKSIKPEVKIFAIENTSDIIGLLKYIKLPFNRFNTLSLEQIEELISLRKELVSITNSSNVTLEFLLDKFSIETIYELLSKTEGLVEFTKRTGVALSEIISLNIEKINMFVVNSAQVITLMNYYFVSFDALKSMSDQQLATLIQNPSQAKKLFEIKTLGVVNKTVEGCVSDACNIGIRLAKSIEADGWLMPLTKITQSSLSLAAELKPLNLKFYQFRAVIDAFTDINHIFANLLICKYLGNTTNINFPDQFATIKKLFKTTVADQLIATLSGYIYKMRNILNDRYDFSDCWLEHLNVINAKSTVEAEISASSEKINDFLENLIPTLKEGTMHLKHLYLFEQLLKSQVSIGYPFVKCDWKMVANKWKTMLSSNTTPEELYARLTPRGSRSFKQDEQVFFRLYCNIFHLKEIIETYKKLPQTYIKQELTPVNVAAAENKQNNDQSLKCVIC